MTLGRPARPRGGSETGPRPSRVSRSLVAFLPVLFVFGATFAPVPTQVGPVGAAPVAAADPMTWTGATTSISAGANGTDIPVTQPSTNNGIAEFHYDRDLCTGPVTPTGCGGPGISGSWTFNATAASAGRVHLDWRYSGFHAFASVTVGLQLIVHGPTHDDVVIQLAHGGPVSCCTPPSSGFAYAGSNFVDVVAGDTFGFALSGGNGDATAIVRGDLLVATNLVTNGGFEQGTMTPATGMTLNPGDANMPGWTIEDISPTSTGQVDWTGTRWEAADGVRSLELAGVHSTGFVHQDIPTVAGKSYRITFAYSANPDRLISPATAECGAQPGTPGVRLTWGGQSLAQAATFFSGNNTTSAIDWQTTSYDVTAPAGASTQVKFANTDFPTIGCGIVIDDVSVMPALPPLDGSADFAFAADTTSVQLPPGESTTVTVSATPINGQQNIPAWSVANVVGSKVTGTFVGGAPTSTNASGTLTISAAGDAALARTP